MMKSAYLTIVSIILLAVYSPAAEPEAPISKETARSAITTFREDPLSPRGRAAGELVRSFADKDTSVLVQISSKAAPFVNNPKMLTADRTLFMNAFVVGNVDSQLAHNEKKDDPYGGALEVIHVYREMQKRDPTLHLAGIEQLIELEKRGELKSYLFSP
jgi:hypothetical protein